MSRSIKQRTVPLSIVGYTKKGHGLGYEQRADGLQNQVEVPFGIPGDQVLAKLLRKHRGTYDSILEEIVVPSSDRITPRCIHFAKCGGCRWQQISYEHQLRIKQEYVQNCLKDHSNEAITLPILACDPPWHYRNKMEFTFSSNATKDQFLGMILQGGKGRVFNLAECHLVNSWFVDVLASVRQWWKESTLEAYHPYRDTGSLRYLTMREGKRTGDKLVMLTVSGNADYSLNKNQMESFVAAVKTAISAEAKGSLSIFLRIQQIAKGKTTQFYEMQLFGPEYIHEQLSIAINENPINLQFKISPTAFFQPNTQQAEKLYAAALRMAEISSTDIVYDLYCGTGILGICAAHKAKQVIGIEIVPESVLDARENIKDNHLTNITIIQGDVAKILDDATLPKADVVMVDPPRVGLGKHAVEHVVKLQSPKIVYISCNPETQAVDIAQIVSAGYKVVAVQPVDQFPQTIHVENIVLLKKL